MVAEAGGLARGAATVRRSAPFPHSAVKTRSFYDTLVRLFENGYTQTGAPPNTDMHANTRTSGGDTGQLGISSSFHSNQDATGYLVTMHNGACAREHE